MIETPNMTSWTRGEASFRYLSIYDHGYRLIACGL